jgi:hypothetical protein
MKTEWRAVLADTSAAQRKWQAASFVTLDVMQKI